VLLQENRNGIVTELLNAKVTELIETVELDGNVSTDQQLSENPGIQKSINAWVSPSKLCKSE
jgi:hypothetical protein